MTVCDHCGLSFPDDDSKEAEINGQYVCDGYCLHCFTKSKKWEHDNRFSSCSECDEFFEEAKI